MTKYNIWCYLLSKNKGKVAYGCAIRVCSIENTVYCHEMHIKLSFVSCKTIAIVIFVRK